MPGRRPCAIVTSMSPRTTRHLARCGSAAAFLATLVAAAPAARACSACECGDPTLTTMGSEKPFAGRLRLSLDVRYRTDHIGEPSIDQLDIHEERADLAVSWAPLDWLLLAADLPLVHRQVSYVNLARQQVTGPGDVELRAKAFVFRDRHFSPRHLVAVQVGASLPTAPLISDGRGMPLPSEAQLGTGGVSPLAGLSYGFFADPWSIYASAIGYLPTGSRAGLEPGASLRSTVAAQVQVCTWMATRLGIDTRLDAHSLEGGMDDPDSGGFIAYLSPEVVLSPAMDLVVSAAVRVPVANALRGAHREGLIAQLAVTRDF